MSGSALWSTTSLPPYATDSNATITGEDIVLGAAEIQAIAMVLHELVTNAARYGSLIGSERGVYA